MSRVVDYYLSPVSPYSYLGGERFAKIAWTSLCANLADRLSARP